MREIKFRGKRIDHEKYPPDHKWVYGYYFKTPLTDENSGTDPEAGWSFLVGEERYCISADGVVYVVEPESVGEYTGLPDKDGKGMYEGDVLRINWPDKEQTTEIKKVVFEEGQFHIGLIPLYVHAGEKPEEDGFCGCELIGNIHDNPDLLTK